MCDVKVPYFHILWSFSRDFAFQPPVETTRTIISPKTSLASTTVYVAFCLQLPAELEAVWDILHVLKETKHSTCWDFCQWPSKCICDFCDITKGFFFPERCFSTHSSLLLTDSRHMLLFLKEKWGKFYNISDLWITHSCPTSHQTIKHVLCRILTQTSHQPPHPPSYEPSLIPIFKGFCACLCCSILTII